jgi:serine/threonine-protein kinase
MGYLHGLPVPIIYQDLKPEHIIVYEDQIKIVDFGIAASFSEGENSCQSYGTARYAAMEQWSGLPCDERTDVYGIGQILRFLERHLGEGTRNEVLSHTIDRALSRDPDKRFPDVRQLLEQLEQGEEGEISKRKEHLYKNLAVIGMRAGIGATHLAISCNIYLNATGCPSLYLEQNQKGDLLRMADGGMMRQEKRTGFWSCGSFRGTTSRGRSDRWMEQEQGCLIRDFGAYESLDIELEICSGIFLVLGGREWEMPQAAALYEKLRLWGGVVPIVNYGNEQAARYYARHWRRNVYCFPLDGDPMTFTEDKRRFFDTLYGKERG